MTFSLTNPLTADNLIALLQIIITGLIRLSIPIAVILIIWAGVLYMTATGKPEQLKTATRALIWVILGFGILLIASGIVAIIQDFLGVSAPAVGITTMGPTTVQGLLQVLTDISGWLFVFAVVGAVAIIITAGLVYIFSGGNPEQAGKALRILIYAVIGIAVVVLAWAVVNIVSNFLTGQPIFGSLITEARATSHIMIPSPPTVAPTNTPNSLTELFQLLENAVEWLFTFTIIAAVAIIIIAGISYIFSMGNPEQAQRALRTLMYAIVGLVVALLVLGVVNTVGNYLGGKNLIEGGGGASQPLCQPGEYSCPGNNTCFANQVACQNVCLSSCVQHT